MGRILFLRRDNGGVEMDGKIYTCYVKLNPEMVQADGAVTGSKEEVLA